MKTYFLLFGFIALAFVACNELEDINGSYAITSVAGEDMTGEGITLTIVLSEKENRISGNNGCNQYGGDFTNLEGNQVDIGPMMATKMYCVEKATIEKNYMTQLGLVKSVELKNEVLKLMDANGNVLIKAKKNNE